jgi:hypothetical protein
MDPVPKQLAKAVRAIEETICQSAGLVPAASLLEHAKLPVLFGRSVTHLPFACHLPLFIWRSSLNT